MNDALEEFGEERVQKVVQYNIKESAGSVVEKIFSAVGAHVNNASQSDDMTVVLLRRL
jgi:serine phosphatase RsbU (regulator of sigma subunit)